MHGLNFFFPGALAAEAKASNLFAETIHPRGRSLARTDPTVLI